MENLSEDPLQEEKIEENLQLLSETSEYLLETVLLEIEAKRSEREESLKPLRIMKTRKRRNLSQTVKRKGNHFRGPEGYI